jgi:hypothetical protein
MSAKAKESELDPLALARKSGLEKAVREFQDDVIAAAQAAAHTRSSLPATDNPAAEPWPPMRMRTTS